MGTRPRPIIVRFSFYKDKELILKNAKMFKGTNINVSQDFSKMTLDVHRQLREHAKQAQKSLNEAEHQTKSIINYRITYRRVVVTYSSNRSDSSGPTFTRSYTLDFIQTNKNWYVPPTNTSRS